MDVRVGLYRKLSAKEVTLLNCGVGGDPRESLFFISKVHGVFFVPKISVAMTGSFRIGYPI